MADTRAVTQVVQGRADLSSQGPGNVAPTSADQGATGDAIRPGPATRADPVSRVVHIGVGVVVKGNEI